VETDKDKSLLKPLLLWVLYYFLFIYIFFSFFIYTEYDSFKKYGFSIPKAVASNSHFEFLNQQLVFFFILSAICQFLYKLSKIYRAKAEAILSEKK
jgi:hypothetical protein